MSQQVYLHPRSGYTRKGSKLLGGNHEPEKLTNAFALVVPMTARGAAFGCPPGTAVTINGGEEPEKVIWVYGDTKRMPVRSQVVLKKLGTYNTALANSQGCIDNRIWALCNSA